MSTKPDTDTGWTNESPQVNGIYWYRLGGPGSLPDIVQIHNGAVYCTDEDVAFSLASLANRTNEWLGPISPSDFEQLIRLREAAEVMDAAARFALMTPGFIRGRDQLLAAADALRSVLD